MKKLTACFLALVMTLSCTAALADKLVMATSADFPPYEYIDGEAYVGIDIEIAEALAEKLGYDGLEVNDMDFNSVISQVATGKANIGMAGLSATSERMANIYFTPSYATGIQAVIVKEGSPITSVDDLANGSYKIGVQMGTTGDIYVSDEFGDNAVQFYSGIEAVEALKNGKVDCVIIDNEPAKSFVKANEGLTILETKYAEESYAICISKDNVELLGKVSAALQDLMADGTVDTIISKYIPAE